MGERRGRRLNTVEGGVKIARCRRMAGRGGGGKGNALALGARDDRVGVVAPVAVTGVAGAGAARAHVSARGRARGWARRREIFSGHGYCPEISLAPPLNESRPP